MKKIILTIVIWLILWGEIDFITRFKLVMDDWQMCFCLFVFGISCTIATACQIKTKYESSK